MVAIAVPWNAEVRDDVFSGVNAVPVPLVDTRDMDTRRIVADVALVPEVT